MLPGPPFSLEQSFFLSFFGLSPLCTPAPQISGSFPVPISLGIFWITHVLTDPYPQGLIFFPQAAHQSFAQREFLP